MELFTGDEKGGAESGETGGFLFGGGASEFSFASLAAGGGGNSFNIGKCSPVIVF